VPALKPAYLIHGDDHGRIAERRANLRTLAERESGAQGLEVLEGDDATAEAVVAALSALTFALGRRFVIVDGVERWKDAEAEAVAAVLPGPDDDLTVAFFAREEGRQKVPAGLVKAIEKAGGDVRAEATVKPWELPKWAQVRARELGLDLPHGPARVLVRLVGERQQRVLRELEKLALSLPDGAQVTQEDVEELGARSAERKAWTFADALLARDGTAAARAWLELRAQGERLPGLLYLVVRRLRDALGVAARLDAGEAPAAIRRGLRMPPKAAERFLSDVQRTDADALRDAIALLADLELASRGGGTNGYLSEDTRTVELITRLAR
jgi:DNA polymerase III subunit delta